MAIQMKISKAQYQALLNRTMDRRPASQQASVVNEMQGDMGEMGPIMTPPSLPTMMPQMQQMMQQGTPPESNPSVMQPTSNSPLTEPIQVAEKAWMEIKGGLGEQLWNRLAMMNPETSQVKPDAAFIQTVAKFVQNPNSVKDERIKQFITSILGEQPVQGSQALFDPQQLANSIQ